MRLETANRYVGEFECIIQSIYSAAKIYLPTSAQLSEQLNSRVYNTEKYKMLPKWAKNKIFNSWMFMRTKTNEKYIRMFYIGLDDRLIPSHNSWNLFTEEEKQRQMGDNCLPIHHIWMKETIQRNDNGSELIILTPTDKVYWHSEMK